MYCGCCRKYIGWSEYQTLANIMIVACCIIYTLLTIYALLTKYHVKMAGY